MRDTRTSEEIREHYEIEVKLATRLKSASAEERRRLYTEIYEELFQKVSHHPQITNKASPKGRLKKVRRKMKLLGRFLTPDVDYLELGPGDCAMAFEVAKQTRSVVAVDVSPSITNSEVVPENFSLVISDGSDIPVVAESIDVVFSDQLMEHLHAEDALLQLTNVYRCLRSGGSYVCATPNRLSGPHDISVHFDEEASGLHLVEYDLVTLIDLFTRVGFQRFRVYIGGKGLYLRIPVWMALTTERLLSGAPAKLRRTTLARALLGLNVVSTKC